MNECDGCGKAYDCFMNGVDHCKRILKYETELTEDDWLKVEYKAKGVHLNWTRLDGSKPTNLNGRNGK